MPFTADEGTRRFLAQSAVAQGRDPQEVISEFERRMGGLQQRTQEGESLAAGAAAATQARRVGAVANPMGQHAARLQARIEAEQPQTFEELQTELAAPAAPKVAPLDRARAESIREAADIGVPAEPVGPTLEQATDPPGAYLERLGVEPWKIEEWKKQAMASPSQQGPFAVREGRGGFSPSAKVPDVAMLEPADFMYERGRQTPAVQRLMDENYARAMGLRGQAAALEASEAETGATQAAAELRRAQAAGIERENRPLPEVIQEQQQAYERLREIVRASPMLGLQIQQFMQEWDAQNPKMADPNNPERQKQLLKTMTMLASEFAPGYRDMLQSLDPEFALGYLRASGLSAGNY